MGPYAAIWTQIDPIFMILDETPSMIFSIFDAGMASTGPGTYLKRCGSKFCVGWWSEYLHSSHMDPIGEKPVARMDLRYHGPGTMGQGPGTTDHGPGTRTMGQGPRTGDHGTRTRDHGTRTRDHGPGPGTKPAQDQAGTMDQGPSWARDQAVKVSHPFLDSSSSGEVGGRGGSL